MAQGQAGRTERTDPHRPGAIIPVDYEQVAAFGQFSGEEGEQYGMEDVPEGNYDAVHPGLFRCDVCGARYNHGAVLRHKPTGVLITIGHDCGSKYALDLDLDGWKEWHKTARDKRACFISSAAQAWSAAHPEVAEALLTIQNTKRNDPPPDPICSVHGTLPESRIYSNEPDVEDRFSALDSCHECCRLHNAWLRRSMNDRRNWALDILADLARKLRRYGSLSEKQAAFSVKLAETARTWQPRAEDAHVPAPEGRVTFTGTIISIKERPGYLDGTTEWKMTVKVETPDGSWLAWMTAPHGTEKGQTVNVTATLTRGSDAHFAFGKRPVILTDEELEAVRVKEQKKADRAAKKAARQEKEKANA